MEPLKDCKVEMSKRVISRSYGKQDHQWLLKCTEMPVSKSPSSVILQVAGTQQGFRREVFLGYSGFFLTPQLLAVLGQSVGPEKP